MILVEPNVKLKLTRGSLLTCSTVVCADLLCHHALDGGTQVRLASLHVQNACSDELADSFYSCQVANAHASAKLVKRKFLLVVFAYERVEATLSIRKDMRVLF